MNLANKRLPMLQAIDDFRAKHGYGPGYRDLCQCLGFYSLCSVEHYLKDLEAQGLISTERNANQRRIMASLRLTQLGLAALDEAKEVQE